MVHKRSSSRLHFADASSQPANSSSSMIPSYSTPDISISTSSDLAFVQSNSVPSMSDIASSVSHSSTSLSSGSASSISSFSSSISANALFQARQPAPQKAPILPSWESKKGQAGNRKDLRAGTPRNETDNNHQASRPQQLLLRLYCAFPESTWDRLILVVFLVSLVALLRAMAGLGAAPPPNAALCVPGLNSSQDPEGAIHNVPSANATSGVLLLPLTPINDVVNQLEVHAKPVVVQGTFETGEGSISGDLGLHQISFCLTDSCCSGDC